MRRALIPSIATLMACLVSTATADLLVTREGETIETRGAWKVKGRQVIFTDTRGVLSSMRLDDVDLEASDEATRKAEEPPATAPEEAPARESQAAEEPARKPVLTLTNENVGRARTPSTAHAPGTAGDDALTEGAQAMGDAMGEAMGELGQAMADGLAQGMEVMGEVLGVMAQAAPRLQTLEQQFDLETPEGIRAAAPGLAQVADFIRSKRSTLSPEAAKMIGEMADELDEVAVLARENPEAALEKRRLMKLENQP